MFCGNCGKEIPDSMKFCVHCGAEQNAVVTLADASSPSSGGIKMSAGTSESLSEPSIPASEPVIKTQAASESVNSVPAANNDLSGEMPNSVPITSASAAFSGVPTPNVIPVSSTSAPVSSVGAPAAFSSVQTAVPPKPPVSMSTISQPAATVGKKQKSEKKYSLHHLVMCLVAAAVMAVAAGVFAALYFLG